MITTAVAVLISGLPDFVKSGAEVMRQNNFAQLNGKKIGLVTNHTATIGDEHLIDILHRNPNLNLTSLFGPEHGLRGEADAGAKVSDGIDTKTGLPVYSLYGEIRRPTPEMLKNCDILVFDIQDVGARFYTYTSTLGLCMQSAAEANIPFLVFDRPNPLGGVNIAGWIRKPQFESFVGQYPIPIQSGLTMGELAQMIKGENFLPNLAKLDLQIAKCEGWQRNKLFSDYNSKWIAPSPNLPSFQNALLYPGMCLFEGLSASEGRGTKNPFLTLGAPQINSKLLSDNLNKTKIPGVKFVATDFTPVSIEGMSSSPKFKDQPLGGVTIEVTNPSEVNPVETGIHLIHAFYNAIPPNQKETFFNRNWLAKLAGTYELEDQIKSGKTPQQIIESYSQDVKQFNTMRSKYLLY